MSYATETEKLLYIQLEALCKAYESGVWIHSDFVIKMFRILRRIDEAKKGETL